MHRKIIAVMILNFLVGTQAYTQPEISGNWKSVHPEKTAAGNFIIREFFFANSSWQVQATLYLDSAARLPVFTFRATGKYELSKGSAKIKNVSNALFRFDKKYMTLRTRDSSLLIRFGLNRCNLVYLKESDITDNGCSYYPSRNVCAQEFDLVSLSGRRLFLGARPANGGMCEISKRPVALGLPLMRVTE